MEILQKARSTGPFVVCHLFGFCRAKANITCKVKSSHTITLSKIIIQTQFKYAEGAICTVAASLFFDCKDSILLSQKGGSLWYV